MFDHSLVSRAPAAGRSWGAFSAALAGHLAVLAAAAALSLLIVEQVASPRPPLDFVITDSIPVLPRADRTQAAPVVPPGAGRPAPAPLGRPAGDPVLAFPETPPAPPSLPQFTLDDLDPVDDGPAGTGGPVDGDDAGPIGSPFGLPGGTGTSIRGIEGPGSGGEGTGSLPLTVELDPPVLVEKVLPDYPEAARVSRLAGKVFVRAVVSAAGEVVDVEVVTSSHPIFDGAALAAVRRWKYRPARLQGRPVAVHFTVIVTFRLH